MLQRINNFFRRHSQKGQGIVEYALILAFVAAIAAFAFSGNTNIGATIRGLFTSADTNLGNAATNAQSQNANPQN